VRRCLLRARLTPMCDESDADAAPAASPWRQVGLGAVVLAVRRRDNWITTETEITVPGVAERPAASPRGERADLFGSGEASVGEGGCLDACRGGLVRHRLSGRLAFGAAVGPDGGDGDGGFFDLGDRNHLGDQQAKHNGDAHRGAAIATLPASDTSRLDIEDLGDVALREAECGEHRVKFGRGQIADLHTAPECNQGAPRRGFDAPGS